MLDCETYYSIEYLNSNVMIHAKHVEEVAKRWNRELAE